ncbi:TraR/DksA family transcriptional regulator [Rhodoligotrophos defluvii]|uniref:TraR/DksA family transcriptional regulator n=1 Tax=Rhodoligotrophos defluvii TaxID=2561934 RepID=UPI0010C9EC00|nr:TraR/DksA C4-type zinc finger protein [Rhodoligotrophos defluvii]
MEPEPKKLEAQFRPQIEQEQLELARRSEDTSGDRRPVELDQQSVGRLSRMDALQVQAMANAVDQRRRARLVLLERALRRMDDGEYGYCTGCGEFIGMRRLAVDPATPKCIRCA